MNHTLSKTGWTRNCKSKGGGGGGMLLRDKVANINWQTISSLILNNVPYFLHRGLAPKK